MPKLKTPPALPKRTTSFPRSPAAMASLSAKKARHFLVASASVSPLPAPSSRTRRSSSSMKPPAHSTPPPRLALSRPSTRFAVAAPRSSLPTVFQRWPMPTKFWSSSMAASPSAAPLKASTTKMAFLPAWCRKAGLLCPRKPTKAPKKTTPQNAPKSNCHNPPTRISSTRLFAVLTTKRAVQPSGDEQPLYGSVSKRKPCGNLFQYRRDFLDHEKTAPTIKF